MNRWRLLGHDRAVRAFHGARRAGRLAHAYLLTGPPGVGRRSFAIRMAQELWCTGDEPPCLVCAVCRRLDDANGFWRVAVRRGHPDETADPEKYADAGERGGPAVEFILSSYQDLQVLRRADHKRDIPIAGLRAFATELQLKPARAPARIGIIDRAHEMNPHGENMLLKTLEEPPTHALIILIAPRLSDVLPTVASRCRHVALAPVAAATIAAHLAAELKLEPEPAAEIAQDARGRAGWAIRMARDPEAWRTLQARLQDARVFESNDRTTRFAAVVKQLGPGSAAAQRERAYAWLASLEAVQANALREAMRQNGCDVPAHERAALRAAVGRLLRLRTIRQQLMHNVTPRLACEDLALRPDAGVALGRGA